MLFVGIIGAAIVIFVIVKYSNSKNAVNQNIPGSEKTGRYYDIPEHDDVGDIDIDQLYFEKLKKIDWNNKQQVEELKELEKTRNLVKSAKDTAEKTRRAAVYRFHKYILVIATR